MDQPNPSAFSPYSVYPFSRRQTPHCWPRLPPTYASPRPLKHIQHRSATTDRNPTASQFAKNASAAYAKQNQPEYQSKPRDPSTTFKTSSASHSRQQQRDPQHGQSQSQSQAQKQAQANSHAKVKPHTSKQPNAPRTATQGVSSAAASSRTNPEQTGQDFKTGASPAERGRLSPTEAFKRLLRSLIPNPAAPAGAEEGSIAGGHGATAGANRRDYSYSVHSPQNARSKLDTDRTSTSNKPQMTAAQAARLALRQKLGYDAVARRILAAMVAAPIAIVLTYHLYRRLIKGDKQKKWGDEDPRDILRPAGSSNVHR